MNHPEKDVLDEIHWIADFGLEFIDLTLEPPCGASWLVDTRAIRQALDATGLDVVGHTAYYLPIGSPFESLRKAAVAELAACLQAVSEVGAKWMNIHPDRYAPMHPRSFYIKQDLKSLSELLPLSQELGVGLMLENLPGDFNSADQLGELFDPMPTLGLHLDYGHANLMTETNTAEGLLDRYGSRLKHVHMHDNKGGSADLHMPLGTGTIDFETQVKALKACGYDGTITLEVFSRDHHYLAYSRDVLRKLWDES